MQPRREINGKSDFNFEDYISDISYRGAEIVGLCPFHNDHSPSFSGNAQTGLWRCFAGCGAGNWRHFLERVGVQSKFKVPSPGKRKQPEKFEIEAIYFYKDLVGRQALRIVRSKSPITGKKKFAQFTRGADGWLLGGFQNELQPYRYEAWSKSRFVILVEGEKVADYLLGLGIPATTTPGGANNWKSSFAKFFADMSVVILPDHDPPGLAYAKSALRDIVRYARKAKIIELPDLKEKEDAFDWFEKRGGSSPLLKQVLQKELSK
jgi:putative DNA primase/helicase